MAKSMKNGSSLVTLIPVESSADGLLPSKNRDSLFAWFELYMGIEIVSHEANTFRAKKGDLQKFVEHLLDSRGPITLISLVDQIAYRGVPAAPEEEARSDSVLRQLSSGATLKHSAPWIQRQRPFSVGNPCGSVRPIDDDDPEWSCLENI